VIATDVLDVGQLGRVVEAALIAGIGVSLAFSLVIRGAVRATECRHQARPVAASAYALLATVALIAVLAAIGFGVTVMLSK
jgi:hypothetical protein